MPVAIHTLVLGPLQTNAYVLCGAGHCAVVDPGMVPHPLVGHLRRAGDALEAILLTHAHCDHAAGAGELIRLWPDARLLCPAADAPMLADPQRNLSGPFGLPMSCPDADELIEPGRSLALGGSRWEVLDTSGHTPGGVSYYCAEAGVVISGDALFAGSIGRTDVPGADAEQLLRNIHRNLLSLPGPTRVLPGHGPETTIAAEAAHNPFLAQGGSP